LIINDCFYWDFEKTMNNIKQSERNYSVIILAAGISSRMGMPKFSLKFNKDFTFLGNIISEYRAFSCTELVVVVNDEGALYLDEYKMCMEGAVKIAVNSHPEWERFYSLKTGLKVLDNINQQVFIHNVDNPFVNQAVLEALTEKSLDADYVSPVYKGRGGHPILLSERILADIISEKHNQLDFREYLNRYSKKMVEVDDKNVLVNINTPEEYKNLLEN
jgi:molybdenum cofactor cytidylyltransferase